MPGRKAGTFALWKNGVYERDGTAAQLAEELCTSESYITASCRNGHVLFGEYQITKSRNEKPKKVQDGRRARAAVYRMVREEDGEVIARGTVKELAQRCQVSPSTIWADAATGYRLLGMFKVERVAKT